MRTFDFAPLWRSTVGFDRLFDMLADDSFRVASEQSYPPYNIERTDEDSYEITLAVAGFTPEEIQVQVHDGVLTVEGRKADKAERLVYKELKKLKDNKLGTLQLHQAKQKFTGQIALAEESRMGLIISMAKSLLDFDHVDTLDEIFGKIEIVTAEQLLEISNDIFDNNLTTLVFEPKQ